MTPEQFIYWLQGFMEIADPKQLDEKQTQILKDHIALVLKKETPIRNVPDSQIVKGWDEYIKKSPPTTTVPLMQCFCGSTLCSVCSSKPLIVTC